MEKKEKLTIVTNGSVGDISVRPVNSKEDLESLKEDWALTFLGIVPTPENLKAMIGWLERYTALERKEVWVCSGKLMNESYGLTKNNAYKDDLYILSIRLDSMKDPNAVALPRFEVEGRWMYDIIENNARREMEQRD